VDEVKDIVQDVFLKAYNSWVDDSAGIPDEKTARNYLYIIARQRMIDVWRSGRNKYQVDLFNKNYEDSYGEDGTGDFDLLESDMPLPEDIFLKNENKQKVTDLLNKLKQEDRELLVLRYLEELEYRELADIYKTSEDNLRQKVSRALTKLKGIAKKVDKEN
jgi:RNA polymerase sigma-70 factor (ECF subfamily)